MTLRECPECGYRNEAIRDRCLSCGHDLSAVPPPPSWSYRERGQIDRTAWGLGLLAVSFLLIWVPFVNLVGGLLGLVGVVLLFSGKEVFGPRHSRNVSMATVLFIAGVIGTFVAFTAAFDVARAVVTQDVEAFAGDLTTFLVIALVVGVLTAVGILILPFSLQDRRGRRLLSLAFLAAVLAHAALVAYGVTGGLSDSPDFQSVLATLEWLGYLQAVPGVLNAWAYGHAWFRVRRGETPTPPPHSAPG